MSGRKTGMCEYGKVLNHRNLCYLLSSFEEHAWPFQTVYIYLNIM